MGLKPPHTPELEDEDAERVRLEFERKIVELQGLPSATTKHIRNVSLVDGVATTIPHGLGRPVFVTHTPPRGALAAGWIEEVRDGTHDRTKYVVLKANSFGATITVDVEVK